MSDVGYPDGSAPDAGAGTPGGRLRGSANALERILGALGEAVTITEADGRLVFANAAALERMGVGSFDEALAAGPAALLARFEITLEDGSPLRPDDLPGRRLLRGEPAEPLLLRLIDRTRGRLWWTLVKATAFEDDDGRPLAVNVLEDVTETKEQELRARFLSRASEVFSSSLEYEETMRRIARLAVPVLADWCGVEMVEGGEIRQVAVAHVDPAKLEFAREFRNRYPPRLDDPGGVGAVLRTGQREFYAMIPEELLIAGARDGDHLRLVRELGLRSVIIVPMRLRDRVIGAISFVAAETAGAFDEDDLAFAEDFATRAATAIENARLYRERSEAARTLQSSLLPPALPSVEGWRMATFYRAADPEGQVGGDFYDLFASEEAFTVVIGDVTGKGIRAAALTALTRHYCGAAALLGFPPGRILALLNRVLCSQPDLSLVTAVVARFEERAGQVAVSVASAGHPLPLRHRPGQAPVEIGASGLLLGLQADASWSEATAAMEPGDTLLFYTDGVPDAPGAHGRYGEARLRELIASCPADPTELLRGIERAVTEFETAQARDDSAMLAVQLAGGR